MTYDRDALLSTLKEMKDKFEDAIIEGGASATQSLIRSKKLIEPLHEYVIKELRNRGIRDSYIYRDKKIYGFPKSKTQDLLIQKPQNGKKDESTGPLMTINIRSQLSSIRKNYDTLYERLYAEAISLHNRFPTLVTGYVYLLPNVGYDSKAIKDRKIELTEKGYLEKWIYGLNAIAKRASHTDVPWRYEEVCCLIVDFERDPPTLIDNIKVLVDDGLVSKEFGEYFNFNNISVNGFFEGLLRAYNERSFFISLKK